MPNLARFLKMPSCCLSILLLLLALAPGCKTSTPPNLALAQTAAAQSEAQVKINPGDLIQVTFPAASQNNTSQRVRVDGKIQMPLVGDVTAAGKTPLELQEDLRKLYEKQLQIREVVVILGSTSASIFVSGAVAKPGRIPLERPMTVLDAIMEAGGFDARRANVKKVTIIRQNKGQYTRQMFNLKPVLNGQNVRPFWLQPFDIIFVPEKLF